MAKTKALVVNMAIVTAFAEAWREEANASKRVEDMKDAMKSQFDKADPKPIVFQFADGMKVSFIYVEGAKTAPVDLETARRITGFGDANLFKIAGNVSAKKVAAMVELGTLTKIQGGQLVPTGTPYSQVRGNVLK